MKIGIIADIHGNRDALVAVLAALDRQGVDAIVNLGDLLAGPLDARGTADILQDRAFLTVRGNHDRVMGLKVAAETTAADRIANAAISDAERAWLAGLPPTALFEGEVFLCHGSPSDDLSYWIDRVTPEGAFVANRPEAVARMAEGLAFPVLLCGHTHFPRMIRLRDGRMVLNPGSVGLPGYEWDEPALHRVEAGAPDACFAVIERRNGLWSAALMREPYDPAPMAALARRNGLDHWATVLQSGWL